MSIKLSSTNEGGAVDHGDMRVLFSVHRLFAMSRFIPETFCAQIAVGHHFMSVCNSPYNVSSSTSCLADSDLCLLYAF